MCAIGTNCNNTATFDGSATDTHKNARWPNTI